MTDVDLGDFSSPARVLRGSSGMAGRPRLPPLSRPARRHLPGDETARRHSRGRRQGRRLGGDRRARPEPLELLALARAEDCARRCLAQIEAAPPECVLQTVLVDWYRRADCGVCGREIGEVHWVEYKPALLTPQRKTVEWEDVTPENLTEVLRTHQRVCWRCHLIHSWRERFPGFGPDDHSAQPL